MHWPRSLKEIGYRLYLLRRLTLVCAAIAGLGLVVAHGMQDGGLPWSSPGGAVAAALGLIALFAGLNTLFPAGWFDQLGLALALACAAPFWPAVQAYVQDGPILLTGSLAILCLMLVMLAFVWLIAASFGRWRMGERTMRSEMVMPVSAPDVIAHEFPRPGVQAGRRRYGAADEDGLFPVWYGFVIPDPENDWHLPDPNPEAVSAPDAYLRVIEQGERHQVTQYLLDVPSPGAGLRGSLVARQEVEPLNAHSCRYVSEEVHDIWDLHTWVSGWLVDQSRDYVQNILDEIRGVAGISVRAQPQITLLSLIARGMTKAGLTPQKPGHAGG